jgi:Domain of unknown function (DUF4337)
MSGHGAHADPNDPFQKRVAISMALYTVGLAFTNALTNSARSASIILANDAAQKWSYFQSKSIKEQLKRLEISLGERLATPGAANFEKEKSEVSRYETEKKEIEGEARALETQQKVYEHREHRLEYAAIAFELGIVLAGVALLQHSKVVFQLSLACAGVALTGLVYVMLIAH